MENKTPIPLVNAEKTDEVIAYACGKCGLVVGSVLEHGDRAKVEAETHCGPWICQECGAEHKRRHQQTCDPCFRARLTKRDKEREAAAFEKAERVTPKDYSGPVFWDGGGCNDGFFATGDELEDWCACEEIPLPPYVWTCRTINPSLDFVSLCEQALDDQYEDCELDAEDELKEFLEKWNAKQTSETWEPNYKRVVILGEANV